MRFSLRSMFVGVACAAAYCGAAFGAPLNVSVIILGAISVFLPPAIVGGIVYSRGAWRAFSIGCAVGAVPLVVTVYYLVGAGGGAFLLPAYSEGDGAGADGFDSMVRNVIVSWHLLIAVYGAVVAAMRWLCRRGAKAETIPDHRRYSVLQGRISRQDFQSTKNEVAADAVTARKQL